MANGRLAPAEHLLARVERGEISPAEALVALSTAQGQGVAQAPARPATPAGPSPRAAAQKTTPPASTRTGPPRPPSPPSPPLSTEPAALHELRSLTGLGEVKDLIGELHAFLEVQRRRRSAGLKSEPQSLHMVFRGNPGTGKTTVARILGRLFKEAGVLEKGHMVEVERADLVGEYIGHTAQKVREQVKKAMGGVLFVDEAYSLARGGEKDFGKEAIDALVKAMEDHRHNLVLILAGYRDEMDWFVRQNPGLRSRFPIHIDFPDYTADELLRIAGRMAAERDYVLTEEARRRLLAYLETPAGRREWENGNARLIRNLLERAIRRQAVRLVREGARRREDLMLLTATDVAGAIPANPALPAGTAATTPGGQPADPVLVLRDLIAQITPARQNGRAGGMRGGGIGDHIGEQVV